MSIKKLGFKSLRIPVTYHTRFEADDLTVKAAWLDRVEEVIDWCLELDFYCVTNVHHDSWNWADFSKTDNLAKREDKFYNLWKQLTTRFAKKSLKLVFEPLNEPVGETAEAAKEYNKVWAKWVDIVRGSGGNNADRHITVPSMKTAVDFVKDLEFEDKRNNWSLHIHSYSPYPFAFSAWGNTTWGSDGDKQEIIMEWDKALAKNPAIILGEYSKIVTSKKIATRAGARKWYSWFNSLMEKHGICGMLWDDGSIYDRHAMTWPLPHESLYPVFHSDSAQSYPGTVYLERGTSVTRDYSIFIHASNAQRNDTKKATSNALIKTSLGDAPALAYKDGTATYTLKSHILQSALKSPKNGIVQEMTFDFEKGAQMMIPIVVWEKPTTPKSIITLKNSEIGSSTTDLDIPINFNGSELAGIRGVILEKGDKPEDVTQENMKCAVGQDSFTQYFGPDSHCFMTYNNQFKVTDTGISLTHAFVMSQGAGTRVLLTLDFQPRTLNQLNITLEYA